MQLTKFNSAFTRFLLGGAANTALTYLLFLLLLRFMHSSLAYSITFICGIVFAYVLNAIFVFRAEMSYRSALQFPGVYLVQYLVGLALLWLLSSHVRDEYAMLIVIAVNVPLTFLLMRFVFAKPKPSG